MPSRYQRFDVSQLELLPLSRRESLVTAADVLQLGDAPMPFDDPALPAVAAAMRQAKARGASIILMMGAHVIKQGLSRYVIDLIRRGYISVVAMNGACAVHDFELATAGATSESVAKYIAQGQFGLWSDTGQINDIVSAGAADGLGFGEALGKALCEEGCRGHLARERGQDTLATPHKDLSIFAAAYECGVPATVHVGIGYDIIHEHPNFDGAAAGRASHNDFLTFVRIVQNLEGGVVLCCGTAVMGPEVYLKALSMARNVARQGRGVGGKGGEIRHFTSAVFDLLPLSGNLHAEAPKDSPEYYYRPYKTVLVRTVKDGGTSHYIRGDHRATLPALHKLLMDRA